MVSETEAAVGNATINYEVASTAVEMPVVVVGGGGSCECSGGARGRQQWQRRRQQ
jgi:hypothetical protein